MLVSGVTNDIELQWEYQWGKKQKEVLDAHKKYYRYMLNFTTGTVLETKGPEGKVLSENRNKIRNSFSEWCRSRSPITGYLLREYLKRENCYPRPNDVSHSL